jgi:hypothetical protein
MSAESKKTEATKTEAKPVMRKPSIEEQLNDVELVSLGYVRIPKTDTYVSYRVTTKNGKVVSMKPVVHADKVLAAEEVKIDFVKLFVWELEES